MLRANVCIFGKVQGVFFRAHTQAEAQKLGITGWVRNLPDGRVEAVFEGEKDKVEKMIQWCWHGSPAAQVEDVTIKWEERTGEFERFEIRK